MTLTDSLRITGMELAHQACTSPLREERTSGPTRPALLAFFQALERITLERRALLKAQRNGGDGGEAT